MGNTEQDGDEMLRRRQHRRQEAAERTVYQVRERVFDIGDDYWIETTGGRRAFKVDGKVLRVRDTFVLEGPDGREVAKMQKRPVRVRDTFEIERPGKPEAVVHKAMLTPLRERWVVKADDIGEWKVQGNVLDHEYSVEQDGRVLAEVSKRWFRVRDTYGIEVDPSADAALLIAVTVAVDQMAHD